jgi:hypothetical protein
MVTSHHTGKRAFFPIATVFLKVHTALPPECKASSKYSLALAAISLCIRDGPDPLLHCLANPCQSGSHGVKGKAALEAIFLEG